MRFLAPFLIVTAAWVIVLFLTRPPSFSIHSVSLDLTGDPRSFLIVMGLIAGPILGLAIHAFGAGEVAKAFIDAPVKVLKTGKKVVTPWTWGDDDD